MRFQKKYSDKKQQAAFEAGVKAGLSDGKAINHLVVESDKTRKYMLDAMKCIFLRYQHIKRDYPSLLPKGKYEGEIYPDFVGMTQYQILESAINKAGMINEQHENKTK